MKITLAPQKTLLKLCDRTSQSRSIVHRALAVRELPDGIPAAIADLTASIEAGFRETRVYFVRAELHQSAGNVDEAAKDRELGLSLAPEDPRSWIARALQKLPDHPQDALADIEAAARLDPILMMRIEIEPWFCQNTCIGATKQSRF